jgi:cell division protein FtsB
MAEVLQFIWAVLSHWQAYVTGGVLTAVITAIERWRGKPFSWRFFAWFLGIFLLVAFFLAWRDEHSALRVATQAIATLEKDKVRLTTESKEKDRRIAELEAKAPAAPKAVSSNSLKNDVRSLIRDLRTFQSERQKLEHAFDGTIQGQAVDDGTRRLFQQRFTDRLRRFAAELPQYLSTESGQLAEPAMLGGDFIEPIIETLLKVSASL